MAFLTANGIALPVADARSVRKVRRKGRKARSFRGQARNAFRGHRAAWEIQLVVQGPDEAEAFTQLMEGAGHFIDFRHGLSGQTMLKPMTGFPPAGVVVRTQAWGPFGRGVLTADATLTSNTLLAYDCQFPSDDDWTVIWCQYDSSTLTWKRYVKRSDGVCYVAGTRDDTQGEPTGSSGIYPRITDGVVEIIKTTSAVLNLADLVMLPYRVPLDWIETLSGLAAGKWGHSPFVRLAGDFAGRVVHAACEYEGADIIAKAVQTPLSWVTNGKVLRFTAAEVNQTFAERVALGVDDSTPTPPGSPLWWFDGSDVNGNLNAGLAHGDAVVTWVDKGSRGQDATQGTAGNRPLFQATGEHGRLLSHPSVKFDGAGDHLRTTTGASASNVRLAAVLRFETVAAGNDYAHDGVDVNGRIAIYRSTAQLWAETSIPIQHPTASAVAGQWAYTILNTQDEELDFNGDNQSVSGIGSTAVKGITLGGLYTGASNTLDGHIVELIAWSPDDMTNAEITAYFEERYGALPQT